MRIKKLGFEFFWKSLEGWKYENMFYYLSNMNFDKASL